MSDTVKLSGKLPGNLETNGLDAIAPQLLDDPEQIRVGLIWFDTSKITTNTDTGDHVPTVRVRRIEPVGTIDTYPDGFAELASAAFSDRTGRDPIDVGQVEATPDHTLDDEQYTIDDAVTDYDAATDPDMRKDDDDRAVDDAEAFDRD